MKRNLIFTVVLVLVSLSSVSAQEISLVGGLNISNLVDKDKFDNYAKDDNYRARIGGHGGVLIGFNLNEVISLQTGVLFSTKGFRLKEEDRSGKAVFKYKLNYLDIPLLASYNYSINQDFKVYVGLGPTLGIAIGGKEVFKWDDYDDRESGKETEKISFGNKKIRDDLKRIDLGLMAQAGLRYDNFKIGLFFNHGLLNISHIKDKQSNYRARNKVFGISAAYVIDLN